MSVIELLILMERSGSRCCSAEFHMFPALVDLPHLAGFKSKYGAFVFQGQERDMVEALSVLRAQRESKHHLNVVSTRFPRLNLCLKTVQGLCCSCGTREKSTQMGVGHKWLVDNFILSASWPVGRSLPPSPSFFHVLPSMSSLEIRGRKSRMFCFEIIRSLDILPSHFELWVLHKESQSSSPRHFLSKYERCGRLCLLGSVFLQLREVNPPAIWSVLWSIWRVWWSQLFQVCCRCETQTHLTRGCVWLSL